MTERWELRPDEGSSPLARGLRPVVLELPDRERIIPARAGFTSGRCPSSRSRPDHPRSRGVYTKSFDTDRPPIGSSPLARGLHGQLYVDAVQGRIIPARAGFTRRRILGRLTARDHPRSRGVYAEHEQPQPVSLGSSPLARGLPGAGDRGPPPRRIIPARAGFTVRAARQRRRRTDHPRSRGVYATCG